MMKKLSILLLTITIALLQNCKIAISPATGTTNVSGKTKTGFNQNFSMMPSMTEALYKNIQKLKPQMLRYPGGTVTHAWNWREGIIESRNSNAVHPISEIKTLVDYTNAKFVFVLDILNKPLADQVQMLKEIEKLNVPIEYIELGNELYAQEDDYKAIFPTGKDYANRVNQWIPVLRTNFPKAKIAALLLGRKVNESNTRLYQWNRLVVDNTINSADAFTYHFYINENATFQSEKADFLEVTQNAQTKDKELWITEYGNKQDKSDSSYYTELNDLANFLESFPNVSMTLNHQIIGGTKNKLTEDGKDFVEEGLMYLKRLGN
jgi:sulfite reductase alpha subunit-like flavoprotein